jgi:hypothetical protein
MVPADRARLTAALRERRGAYLHVSRRPLRTEPLRHPALDAEILPELHRVFAPQMLLV